jgi:tetrahydromethanopterin S-methyltransferase subunit C
MKLLHCLFWILSLVALALLCLKMCYIISLPWDTVLKFGIAAVYIGLAFILGSAVYLAIRDDL